MPLRASDTVICGGTVKTVEVVRRIPLSCRSCEPPSIFRQAKRTWIPYKDFNRSRDVSQSIYLSICMSSPTMALLPIISTVDHVLTPQRCAGMGGGTHTSSNLTVLVEAVQLEHDHLPTSIPRQECHQHQSSNCCVPPSWSLVYDFRFDVALLAPRSTPMPQQAWV